METAKKNTGTVDMKAIIDRIKAIQTDYRGGPYGMGYTRGLIQSSWLTDDDRNDPTIGKLASELGATMWTYYNGKKSGLESDVLYWTTEKDFDSAPLTKDANARGDGWSEQTVLSYRYDKNTGMYSVIENRAWLNQLGYDRQKTHNGLAQLSAEYDKPKGNVLGSYSTYEEAQEAYKKAKADHEGQYIY